VQARRIDDLRQLTALEPPTPVAVTDSVYLALPGFGHDPDEWFEVRAEPVPPVLGKAVGAGDFTLDGTRLHLEVETGLHPVAAARTRLILIPMESGRSKAAREVPRASHQPPWRSEPVRIASDGRVSAELEIRDLLRGRDAVCAVRLEFECDDATYTVPVKLQDASDHEARVLARRVLLRARPDVKGRALVELRRKNKEPKESR
jgi:hypothetical protein